MQSVGPNGSCLLTYTLPFHIPFLMVSVQIKGYVDWNYPESINWICHAILVMMGEPAHRRAESSGMIYG